MNSTLQYFSTKKLGSYADICIYSSTFVSLKMLIYSEIYIKPLKTFLFTFLKIKCMLSFSGRFFLYVTKQKSKSLE